MVLKSHGPRRRTREKFRGPPKLTVNKLIQKFEPGQTVAIKISSNSHRGMPFRRFHGRTGKVLEQRGQAYIIEVRDGKKVKKIIACPEHLKPL